MGDIHGRDQSSTATTLKNYMGISVPGVKYIRADLNVEESIAEVVKEVNPQRIFINKWRKSASAVDPEKAKSREARLASMHKVLESINVAPVDTVEGPFWPWWNPPKTT